MLARASSARCGAPLLAPLARCAPRPAVGLARRVPVRSYHENVILHYENPRNVGRLDAKDPMVGTGLVGAPSCGDVLKLQVKMDESGRIVDAKFKTFGCGSAIASSSYASEWVKGKTLEECLEVKNTDIAKYLSLPPVKLHCSMLAEDAIKAAIHDLQTKLKANRAAAGSSSSSSSSSMPSASAQASFAV